MTPGLSVGRSVPIGGVTVGAPREVQFRDPDTATPFTLDGLIDVDAPADTPVSVPLALQRGDDDIYRLVPAQAAEARAYRHVQDSPAALWQVLHGLAFEPAGVLCKDSTGVIIEPSDVTHPEPGITEILFGDFSQPLNISGVAWLS